SPVLTQEQSPSSSVPVSPSPIPVTHTLPTRMPPLVIPSQGEWETWRSVELPDIVNIRTLAIWTTWDEHCGQGQGASYFLQRTSSGLAGTGQFKGEGGSTRHEMVRDIDVPDDAATAFVQLLQQSPVLRLEAFFQQVDQSMLRDRFYRSN